MTVDLLTPWLGYELWTLKEAAYLLCGQEPRSETHFIKADRDTGGAVGQAYRALKDATHAGSLEFTKADARDTLMRRRVRPRNAVAWAANREMPVPDLFKALARAGTRPKLTPEKKQAITKRLANGETVAALAREFRVSRRTIDPCKPPKPAQLSDVWGDKATRHKAKK